MLSHTKTRVRYNYLYKELFGHHVWGDTIGNMWLCLVKAILDNSKVSFDEGRSRIDIQNVRVKSDTQTLPDKNIEKYGDDKNLDVLLNLTFKEEKMVDTDIVASFPPGADSYYKRIVDGDMINFVITRLATFPESKKAVMVFPNNNDYKAVLAAPNDDYLPCIVSIQFRLVDYIENEHRRDRLDGYILKTVFMARSIDAFQKSYANFWAMARLSHIIAEALSKKLNTKILVGSLDGFITDAHIYQECIKDANNVIKKWQN